MKRLSAILATTVAVLAPQAQAQNEAEFSLRTEFAKPDHHQHLVGYCHSHIPTSAQVYSFDEKGTDDVLKSIEKQYRDNPPVIRPDRRQASYSIMVDMDGKFYNLNDPKILAQVTERFRAKSLKPQTDVSKINVRALERYMKILCEPATL